MNKYGVLILFCAFLVMGCKPDPTIPEETVRVVYPEVLQEAIRVLDPEQKWGKMGKLAFTMTSGDLRERHLVDLNARKTRIESEDYVIGFDGQQAWVAPSKAAFPGGSARFYHSLNFYFFAMPHVFTDPGIKYRVFKDRELDGRKYKVLYIGFEEGVGDTSYDEYTAYFDPETNRLAYVLYTVTYFRENASDQFYACKFDAWQEVDGILVPKKLTFLDYSNGKTGAVQNVRYFSDVTLSPRKPWDSRFNKPRAAAVDSLPDQWRK